MNQTAWRRVLLTYATTNLCAAVGFWVWNCRIAEDNSAIQRELELPPKAPDSSERLVRLRTENARLVADVQQIPQLKVEKANLGEEIAKLEGSGDKLESDRGEQVIHREIEATKAELRQLRTDIENLDEADARKAAQDYLAQKAPPPSKTAKEIAAEYDSLGRVLKKFALGFQKQREAGQLLFTGSPEDKQRAKPLFAEARATLSAASDELGQDRVLYKELRVPLDKPLEAHRVPVLQSLVPDQRGVSITVFLDGNVVFSPPVATTP